MSAIKNTSGQSLITKLLSMLFWIFLIGFALQAAIHMAQTHYSEKLDREIQNAQIQGILGGEIISHIQEVEKSYYALTNQLKPKTRALITKEVEVHIDEINKLINVLEHGGVFTQQLQLNLPDKDNVINTWTYNPTKQQAYDILRIDVVPKLNAILEQFDKTNALLDVAYDMLENNSELFTQQLEKIQHDIKRTNPLFIRLLENTNRIHYQQQNYLKQLEEDVEEQKFGFKIVQYASIVFLLLLSLVLFKVISRHIDKMTQALQVQKDKALAATESKSQFLANMSHEIRTPLNAITGFINLLKQQESEPTKVKYLNTIDNSSQSLLGIINDILDFSKIESNKLEFDLIDFDPHESFSSVADLFKAKCSEKNILLHVNIDKEMPQSLHSDPLRIKQVISNLLSNAVKFSEEGKEITLDIKYNRAYQELSVVVVDQGIGISEEQQGKIFEAFSQAEANTTRQFGGTGLGLAICSLLVELLGGHLDVESELGVGSRFSFSLPIKEGQPINKASTTVKHTAEISGRVLLVEDNATNQLLMGAILKKMQIQYDLAKDGLEAVTAFEEHNYDLILMDENMPNMSGSQATQKIRELEMESNLGHTPIVALTANAMKGDRERFIQAGMDDYLSKPLQIPELNRVIQEYLSS